MQPIDWLDWANPLLPLMGQRPADDFQQRYRGAVEEVFRCPSNQRVAGPVNFGSLEALIAVPKTTASGRGPEEVRPIRRVGRRRGFPFGAWVKRM